MGVYVKCRLHRLEFLCSIQNRLALDKKESRPLSIVPSCTCESWDSRRVRPSAFLICLRTVCLPVFRYETLNGAAYILT